MKSIKRIVRPVYSQLDAFTREELREYAKRLGLRIGRNKYDVMMELMKSLDTRITIELGRKL